MLFAAAASLKLALWHRLAAHDFSFHASFVHHHVTIMYSSLQHLAALCVLRAGLSKINVGVPRAFPNYYFNFSLALQLPACLESLALLACTLSCVPASYRQKVWSLAAHASGAAVLPHASLFMKSSFMWFSHLLITRFESCGNAHTRTHARTRLHHVLSLWRV